MPPSVHTPPAGFIATRQVLAITQLVCLGIAVMLSLIGGRFIVNLVYSLCIGNCCAVFINLGRWGLARWRLRLAPQDACVRESAEQGWPGWRWGLPLILVGGGLGYLLGAWLAANLIEITLGLPLHAQPHPHTGPRWQGWLAVFAISMAASAGVTGYFYSRARLAASEAAAQAAARTTSETQLRLLQSQLEPHMLFNTLANLRALIGVDPERAQLMLDQLIAFLRATLSASQTTLHPLQAEFDRLADYLALMQIRMGPRLGVTLELPAELAHHPVPTLLLQALVENAIKHGLEPLRRGGHITVNARAEGKQLCLEVRDTGRGLSTSTAEPNAAAAHGATQPGLGFGTAQIRERLATLYGEQASFTLTDAPQGGTLATVLLPLGALSPCQ